MVGIRIRAKKAGFRRCGIAHEDKWKEYPADRFTPEEIKQLWAEPLLDIEFIHASKLEPEPQPEPEPKPTKKGK